MPLPRKLKLPLIALAWIMGLATFYVLSTGPAAFLIERLNIYEDGPTIKFLVKFYGPLGALENTPFEKPLRRYVDLWDSDE